VRDALEHFHAGRRRSRRECLTHEDRTKPRSRPSTPSEQRCSSSTSMGHLRRAWEFCCVIQQVLVVTGDTFFRQPKLLIHPSAPTRRQGG
jgi:hypothetical protein